MQISIITTVLSAHDKSVRFLLIFVGGKVMVIKMLEEFFKAMLITSFAGTVFAMLLTIIRPITKKYCSGAWNYYIWVAALLIMLVPVKFNIPKTDAPQTIPVYMAENKPHADTISHTVAYLPQKHTPDNAASVRTDIIAMIWIGVAACLLLSRFAGYALLCAKIKRNSRIISCPELASFTRRKITVRKSSDIASPLMTGFFKPVLMLPDTEITQEQLYNILLHEMTHFKRHDILCKWFVCLVKSIHWFNPSVYLISRQINTECEISCDLSVTEHMSEDEEICYINTILALLPKSDSKSIPLTTGMAGNRKILKRRFIMIRNRTKPNKTVRVISAISAVIAIFSAIFAGGVIAADTIDNSNITIKINGGSVKLNNKPYEENGEVYIPLRETLEKTGAMDSEASYINYDNGDIIINIAHPSDSRSEDEGTTVMCSYKIAIGDAEIVLNPTPTLTGQDVSVTYKQASAPVLKDGVTYVPASYIYDMTNGAPEFNYNATVFKDGKEIDRYSDYNVVYYDADGNAPASVQVISELPPVFQDPYSPFMHEQITNCLGNDLPVLSYSYINSSANYANADTEYTFNYQIILEKDPDKFNLLSMTFAHNKEKDEWYVYDSSFSEGLQTIAVEGEPLNSIVVSSNTLITSHSNLVKDEIDNYLKSIGYEYDKYTYEVLSQKYISDKIIKYYVELRPDGQDSYDYLTMTFTRRGDEWIMDDASLEK